MLNASEQQVEAIRRISLSRGLYTLPPALEQIARLRLEHTHMSLTELGQMMNPPVGKSGVNHRMRRLMAIAKEIEQETNEQEKEEMP